MTNWTTLKEFDSPSLIISLYYHELDDLRAFAHLLNVLTQLGASLTGKALLLEGNGVRTKPFSRFDSDFGNGVKVAIVDIKTKELYHLLDDSNIRVVAVNMNNIIGLTPHGEPEIVQYRGISEEAMVTDHHPMNIVTAGGEVNHGSTEVQANLGGKVYRRFIELIRQTSPAYAGIGIQDYLPNPFELKQYTAGDKWWPPNIFENIYVSSSYVGSGNIEKLKTLYLQSNAYAEPVIDGYYFSCWHILNPLSVSARLKFRTIEVSRILSDPMGT